MEKYELKEYQRLSKQVLITIENKHHLETKLINADGHTFTYNPSGKNEGLEDFFISAPEEKIQLLMDGMEISNKLIKEILTEKTKSELGEFIYTNLTNAYWRNEGAINKYLNQDAELTNFCDLEEPTMENYGWQSSNSFEEESGWMFEGGEDAYYKALKKWESQQS